MKHLFSFAVAVAVALMAVPVMADGTGSSGAGTFTDNAGSSEIVTVSGGAGETVTDVEIVVGNLTHTWIGDIQMTLTSPDGTSVSIMDGVGSIGNTGAGASTDFLGGDFTFNDAGGDLWLDAGAGDLTGPLSYQATDIDGNVLSMASAFAGETVDGDWIVDIFDRATGDTGGWDSITVNVTGAAVPEPGSVALLGLVAMGFVARRRR